MASNHSQMGFGGAWTEGKIEKQDSRGRLQSLVTAPLYSEILRRLCVNLTASHPLQLKVRRHPARLHHTYVTSAWHLSHTAPLPLPFLINIPEPIPEPLTP